MRNHPKNIQIKNTKENTTEILQSNGGSNLNAQLRKLDIKEDRWKIDVAVMKFLRSLSGYTLMYHTYNTDIRVELNIYHRGNKIEHRERISMNIS
jgi:hypothetical protein